MIAQRIFGALAVTLAFGVGTAVVQADTQTPGLASSKLQVTPAVLTNSGEASVPVTEVQYRGRVSSRGWGYSYPYRSYSYRPSYGYSYRPSYGYGYRPYYGGYYSSYRPYSSFYYPRYYTGYRGGMSYFGPRFSGSFYW